MKERDEQNDPTADIHGQFAILAIGIEGHIVDLLRQLGIGIPRFIMLPPEPFLIRPTPN